MNADMPGIYAIRCMADGKNTTYIGQAGRTISKRWNAHRKDLKENRHFNKHLQNAWNLYGESGFDFIILENAPSEILVDKEQYWLDKTKELFPIYNFGKVARNPMLGETHTDSARKKMSESRIGKHYSYEHRCNMSRAAMGHPVSEKTKQAVSRAAKARHPDSPETRAAKGKSFRGKKFTQDHKDKISLSQACPYPYFTNEKTGIIIPSGIGLNRMCKKMNLSTPKMSEVMNKKRRSYRGWILREA